MALLQIERLRAGYANTPVLRDLTLDLEQGEVVAVLGPNGAGKSTLLKAVSGMIRPSYGTVRLDGTDITAMAANRRVRHGLAQSPEGRRMFPYMTTEENLRIGAYTRRDRERIDEDVEHFFSLWPVIERRRTSPAGLLSGGEQQIVAIGRAVLAEPKVLLLDEPSLGLAPVLIEDLYDGLRRTVRERHQSVVLVEQNAEQALKLADRVHVLVGGEIVHSGPAADITAADVAGLYFSTGSTETHP